MAASRQLEHSDKSVETSGKKRQLVSGECADRRRGLRHGWAEPDDSTKGVPASWE